MEVRLIEKFRIRSQFVAALTALAKEGEHCNGLLKGELAGNVHRRCHYRKYRYRNYSTTATSAGNGFKEAPRINPVGIQYLSESLHRQLFGNKSNSQRANLLSDEKKNALVNLAKQSLSSFDLLGKKTCISEPISFQLPKLQGNSLDEHFQKIGHYASEPYRTMAVKKFVSIVPRPPKWERKSGWVRYAPGKPSEKVKWPLEDTMVFDVETLYQISHFPTLAVAITSEAWYLWCSPYICGDGSPEHLIPMDSTDSAKLVIGHNVAYDRARVLEEYNFKSSKTFFVDTQSLHIASSGLCSRQRPRFMKTKKSLGYDSGPVKFDGSLDLDAVSETSSSETLLQHLEEDPWLSVSAMNSLRDVAFFHCGIRMDKEPRNLFSSNNKNVVVDNFEKLVNYCATDVETTSKVFDKVLPLFLQKCPHPVSFGALRFLSSCILPTRHSEWNDYIKRSEDIYQDSKKRIESKIIEIIEATAKLANDNKSLVEIKKDPWLRQLDWTIKPIKITKKGLPAKNQKFPGFPEWYRSLFPNKTAQVPLITIKSRNIPMFFKLSWEGYPCIWTDNEGWCFPVPSKLVETFKEKNYFVADKQTTLLYLQDLREKDPSVDQNQVLFKIPHPNGPQFNCTTLLSKPYIHFFEKGILSSQSDLAHEALQMNSFGSYWMSSRERIVSQFVVPQASFPNQFKDLGSQSRSSGEKKDLGVIIPGIIPMGTVTRRAVEKTWLTASNAKSNRVGSELKAQIKAPPGYCFVGADVDSEELWIASLVGDSVFNIHGGTAIGWMCLEGTKNEGTDLHTKTSQILGCTRSEAKIFNYGRIYGAGVKFAAQLLKSFNHSLTAEQAKDVAKKLYESTKGKTRRSKIFKKFWHGGSESILFNKLESIAEQDEPRTPVLGCGITASLLKKNLGANSFLPSRINWAIQSSGVDYLHLLICSMNYLISKYKIDARLCLSIHDEIRYLAADKDKYRTAMALQVSNIWTRAIFCEQMGIDDLPQSCAFFSAVDIDHVIRKEVDMDCITPSNSNAIPHGESLDINQLLNTPQSFLVDDDPNLDISSFLFHYREPVFSEYNKAYGEDFLDFFLKMQIQNSKWKISALEAEYIREKAAHEFQKDGLGATFGLLDYLKDIEKGKQERLSIMGTTSFTKFNNANTLVDEKMDTHSDLDVSSNVNIADRGTRLPTFGAVAKLDRNRDADETNDSSIIEELHNVNSKPVFLKNASKAIDTSGKRKRRENIKPLLSENALRVRPRRVYGNHKEYEAFYNSLNTGKQVVSNKKNVISRIPIEDVVEDVLNDSKNIDKKRTKGVVKISSKLKKKMPTKTIQLNNFDRRGASPVDGSKKYGVAPSKLH